MKVIKYLVILVIVGTFFNITSCASSQSIPTPVILNENETEFVESMKNYKISLIQSPKNTDFNKPFQKSYIVQVKDKEGKIQPNFKISVSYPSSKKNNEIIYKTENITTDSEGKISFLPENTNFTVSDYIYFYPAPNSNKQLLVDKLKENGLKTDFIIRSAIITKGAILAVWEYNEKDKPANNFYTLISELQASGTPKAGNAPYSDSTTIGLPAQEIYQKNYDIIGTDFGYLIIGTVKFEKPYEKINDIYNVYIIAEFKVIDMANGKELYQTVIQKTSQDAKYNNAVSACKKAVARQLINEISNQF